MKEERHDIIIQYISKSKFVKAQDLSEKFQVSMETIRRDLEEMEKEGLIKRVHGGAILDRLHGVEPTYDTREIKNYEEKIQIGKCAASLVEDGDSIIIDLGTTTLEFAKFLKEKKNITVLTNALQIATELSKYPAIKVILLGGNLRSGEISTSGHWAEKMVEQFYVDKLFLGTGALSLERGIMDYHIEETNLRRHFVKNANQIIALADYSKFGIRALNLVCGLKQLDVVVTDEKVNKTYIRDLRKAGIKVIIAE